MLYVYAIVETKKDSEHNEVLCLISDAVNCYNMDIAKNGLFKDLLEYISI